MDALAKKKALRMLTDGVFILTSAGGNRTAASTVTWLTQTSFVPPLVAVGVKRESVTHRTMEASGHFAVNILGKNQQGMAEKFFKHADPLGNTIAGCDFTPGATGSPILTDCPAYFECKVVDKSDIGDHITYIGEVVEAGVRRDEKPLALRDTPWNYGG